MPQVQFDTNKKHKIIDKEHLPLKKIHADSLEKIDQKLLPGELQQQSLEQFIEKFPEDELKVETVEEIEELHDIVIDEDGIMLEPLPEPEEVKIEEVNKESGRSRSNTPAAESLKKPASPPKDQTKDADQDPLAKTVLEVNVDTAEYLLMEEAVAEELEKGKNKEPEFEVDNEPFKDLQDLQLDLDEEADVTRIELGDEGDEVQELKDIGELLKNDIAAKKPPAKPEEKIDNKDLEPFTLEEIKEEELKIELNDAMLKESQPAAGKIPRDMKSQPEREMIPRDIKPQPAQEMIPRDLKSSKSSKEFNDLEEFKKSLQQEEKKNKFKKSPIITKGIDLFDQLKDKTRVTIIKEVSFKGKEADDQFLIDIKDKNSRIMESIKVNITPEIKKVTLIIDVKK
jgi:hypothetical protein